MNATIATAWQRRPSAAAALLFTALLAQAPHAATVFIRIAPQDVQWEVWWLAILGGVVYAIALESATAYFVWRNKMRWAIAFAAFSIMHNVAYYMPGAWTFDVAGAQLSLRYIVSALLISASLPIAIAAFSHVHVEAKRDDEKPTDAATTSSSAPTNAETPVALPVGTTGHQDANATVGTPAAESPKQAKATSKPAPALRNVGKTNEYGMTDTALADLLNVQRQAIGAMRNRGTLAARIARDLPHLAPVHVNGNGYHA